LATPDRWIAAGARLPWLHERSPDRPAGARKEARSMSQTQLIETNVLGAWTALWLLLVLVLTVLGVIAHASFA